MSSTVEIPPSTATVSVSIINTGWVRGIPCSKWFSPRFEGLDIFNMCSYAFLVTHDDAATGRRRRVLFDMGIRKDWQNVVPTWQRIFRDRAVELKVEKDVSEILADGGVDLNDIEAMIWSHLHWDHIGNPTKFPASTKLVVGPGFKEAFMPGWPGNLRAEFTQEDVAGRTIVEISRPQFDVSVGGFPGYDYFGDGSFFILDAPGHVTGHINALARTASEPESYVFMAGDSVHFGGELRPSAQVPLPCSRGAYAAADADLPSPPLPLHPHHSPTTPYLSLGRSFPEDVEAADRTIRRLQAFDGDARVLVVFAHDEAFLLLAPPDGGGGEENGNGDGDGERGEEEEEEERKARMIPQFPRPMDDWATRKTRGGRSVKDAVRWTFLGELYEIAVGRRRRRMGEGKVEKGT
ncbi:beta-lactamase-like protein [Biscogniauxia mediterranea]|nr:beta-lactamase-like protein [Biscogniauxia mediterranea]